MTELDSGGGTSLRDYLNVLRRRRVMIAVVAIVAVAAAVALSLRQDEQYESTAQVLLSRQNLATALTRTPDPSAGQADFSRIVQTQSVVARAPVVADRVVKTLRIPPGELTGGQLLSNSEVEAAENVDVLNFTVRNGDQRRAANLATEYARQYTNYRRELDTAALARAADEVDQQLKRLEQRGETDSQLYANLTDNREQLRTLRTLQTSNASLLHPGNEGGLVRPRPVRNAVVALILGLALGIGLAFLREALDTRVRRSEEVGERLHIPMLGGIPQPPRPLRRDRRLVTLSDPQSPHAEAFRVLRTSLDFANLERGARSIMVTSAVEAEGKSTTVANLAVTLARRGWNVVLADFDLRRPMLHHFFGLEIQPGVTDVARGEVDLDEAIARVTVSTDPNDGASTNGNGNGHTANELQVLTAGTLPPDAGDFVNRPVAGRLIRQLIDRSDLVLIDTPPILQVGDALSLGSKVDGVLLVTRLNALRRPMFRDLDRNLNAMPAAKLGYVVTGADVEHQYGYMTRYYVPETSSRPKAAARKE
jgi:polysaccharide biosynthesis transport protein